MAIARVVSFDGVSKERMEEIKANMAEGDRPEGMPATEFIMLHDADCRERRRDRLLRDGGRLPARRRGAERDAGQ